MLAESPVGLSSVHARANIREPRTTANRSAVTAKFERRTQASLTGMNFNIDNSTNSK